MRRIYLAAASSTRETEAKPYIARLRAAGWDISFDWTIEVDAAEAHPTAYEFMSENTLNNCDLDLRGVETADVVWVLAPSKPSTSTGAWVELGYALGLALARGFDQRPYILVSGDYERCLFTRRADQLIADHEKAFAAVNRLLT